MSAARPVCGARLALVWRAWHPSPAGRRDLQERIQDRVAGCETLTVVIVIAVVTPFRICLLFFTNLPMLALEVIALVIVLLLATGTAWTATAIDHHGS